MKRVSIDMDVPGDTDDEALDWVAENVPLSEDYEVQVIESGRGRSGKPTGTEETS